MLDNHEVSEDADRTRGDRDILESISRRIRVGMWPKAKFGLLFWTVGSLALLSGCANMGYYAQSVNGQLDLLGKQRPIEEILASPDTTPGLRRKLGLVIEARSFATQRLGLPDNGSYLSYADLDRPYAVWVVVATPELSVQPRRWCFLLAGCFDYRGYFSEQRAADFADRLKTQGYDTAVRGGIAYSTLGWFADPVLNTMLRRSPEEIAAVLFHELAHQLLYVKDDTAFNEAFAVLVEREGVRRWLRWKGDESGYRRYARDALREDQLVRMLSGYRDRLSGVFADDSSDGAKRRAKAQIYRDLQTSYERLKERWGGYDGFDEWMSGPINNADLAFVSTYWELVDGFELLLQRAGGDLPTFYGLARDISRLPKNERAMRLGAPARFPASQL